jgi:Holliday junction resolvase
MDLEKVTIGERNTQQFVANYLREKGFIVASNIDQNANGIDIVAIKNNLYFSIEVKTIIQDKEAYRVKSLNKSALKCDYIAMVTPKNNIIFQTIEEHVKNINNSGDRFITKLIKLYDLL